MIIAGLSKNKVQNIVHKASGKWKIQFMPHKARNKQKAKEMKNIELSVIRMHPFCEPSSQWMISGVTSCYDLFAMFSQDCIVLFSGVGCLAICLRSVQSMFENHASVWSVYSRSSKVISSYGAYGSLL